jgi:hypothetical protein
VNARKITRSNVDRSGNSFCGPLVLAAILGTSTAEAAEKVRDVSMRRRGAVKGMYNSELLAVLRANGRTVTEMDVPRVYIARRRPGESVADTVEYTNGDTWTHFVDGKANHVRVATYGADYANAAHTPVHRVGVTLAAWLPTRPDHTGTYVVVVANHYVLISGRKFVDTYTKGEWVSIGKAPHRRKRVHKIFQIT